MHTLKQVTPLGGACWRLWAKFFNSQT